LTSLLANALQNLFWQAPGLIVPLLRGTAALTPYYLGQKFPMGAVGFTHSGGDVLFAASSMSSHSPDETEDRSMLRTAMRWNLLVVLPALGILVVFAPCLLQVWLGQVPSGAVSVARFVAVAAFLDSLCAPVLYFLWGRGLVRQSLPALFIGAASCIVANLTLVPSYGVTGAAVGLLFGELMMTLALVWAALVSCGVNVAEFGGILRNFIAPTALCAATSFGVLHLVAPSNWLSLIGSALPGGLVFLASFYCWGVSKGERENVRRRALSLMRQIRFIRPAHQSAD
jgi:O-antigen/teichoic acid export membrane protein